MSPPRRRESRRREHGNASVFAVACLAITAASLVGLGRLGSAAVVQARAAVAADAAALAAADQLAMRRGESAARRAAQETAQANGARLVSCACGGLAAEVEIEMPAPAGLARPGRAKARAEVDLSRSGSARGAP